MRLSVQRIALSAIQAIAALLIRTRPSLVWLGGGLGLAGGQTKEALNHSVPH
jgi:hypothetical protein